ncbi:ATP-dependent RNA helicase DOB1 [Rhodovulum sp. P5]|uniref:DEAD/DEAH box helicase n=1 Tax=Rhodovulum sp. P5 TaxID=1564506 RepID=UPI0009C3D711|nr:DEAD/DEAH box helicase [Rhodovulum sp. P5]ARE40941.1 ATP-dependent RNA helicase DOB1 [Rhodovulum sp. P5]
MYDPDTAALIRSAPNLPELDLESLPDELSRAFAEIASARVLLRQGVDDPEGLTETIDFAKRLAQAYEALVSLDPDRENRAAAGFVAATAYQLVYQASALGGGTRPPANLSVNGISPDISAMLLFLVAEASADASEVARTIQRPRDSRLQSELILHLIWLARGQVGQITDRKRLRMSAVVTGSGAERANAALYYRLLRGVRALAFTLQGRRITGMADPIAVFTEVKALASPRSEDDIDELSHGAFVVFPGPLHLASLLIAAGSALMEGAVVNLPPPNGVPAARWRSAMKSVAKTRPYLWRNHKEAAARGYLEIGTSSAIGFPTGAGKSTTAQLKIHSVLLSGRKAVFLAPTHALVDQTARDLREAFPTASVQGERVDEFGFASGEDELPDVMVMTPEACLLLSHMEPERFEDVGLLIFDECHLIHPDDGADRRAIDGMLCILGFVRVAPQADLVLLSAMMKNTDEISAWLADLTGRDALALDNAWKPTRQLRGCVVYDIARIRNLEKQLREGRRKKPSGGAPVALQRQMTALPSGFFSVKQTWVSQARSDYALVPFFPDPLPLSVNKGWGLTPNSGVVAASIAAAAAKAGIRTLVFSQSIPNAVSIADKAGKALGACNVELTEAERRLVDIAADEFGDAEQLYLELKDGNLAALATTHHGQLLPEERQLAESLYKRKGGISVLAATPTLGQGMNLPAELVIIAEDSQYNADAGRRDILDPEDLLNAAGRAGRAGESATGIVLVIPGKVVGLDDKENKIGSRWSRLRDIFGQSDQCLVLDDPFTALMDRIHDKTSEIGDLEKYVVARLAETSEGEDGVKDVRLGLARSFGAFRKKQAAEEDWIASRTAAALALLSDGDDESAVDRQPLRDLASMVGMPEDVLATLAKDVVGSGLAANTTVADWCAWMFEWLESHPNEMFRLLRIESIEYLLGKEFKELSRSADRAAFAVPLLRSALGEWMGGAALVNVQKVLSQKARDIKRSTSARKFVIRLVPDLAHVLAVPHQIFLRLVSAEKDEPVEASPGLTYLNQCIRRGYSSAEMAAYAVQMRSAKWPRRETHRRFADVAVHLKSASDGETVSMLETRVEAASDAELNNRDWSDLL